MVLAVVAVALLAGCGARSAQPPAPGPPAAVQAPAAQPAAAAPAVAARTAPRTAPRPAPPPPAAVLAGEIQQALAARRWPAGVTDATLTGAPEWVRDHCLDVSAANAVRCTYGKPTATRSVALVGDSIAVGWLPGLRRAPALRDARISVLTRRQCPNVLGDLPAVAPACRRHHAWVLHRLRQLRPELVVLSSRYEGTLSWQQWQAATTRMIAAVRPYARRVVLVSPPPDPHDVRACLARNLLPAQCGRRISAFWGSYAYAEWKAAATGAQWVDPRPWFCLDNVCPPVVGDLPVTFDGKHVTGAYAARLAPVLSAALS